jgi:hypothetical protein
VGDWLYLTSFILEWETGSTDPLSGRLALPNLIHFGVGDWLYLTSEWEIYSTEPHSSGSGRFALPILTCDELKNQKQNKIAGKKVL